MPPIGYRVSFVDHLICGLAAPIHDFLRGLLFVYGLQLHHHTPNSILHISIFITLCESFLGVQPNWALWKRIFLLHRNGSPNIAYNIGGVVICVRPDVEYFDVKFPDSVQGWHKKWLYVLEECADSLEHNIPPFNGNEKILRGRSWDAEATDEEKSATEALMTRIHELQNTRGELSGIQITTYFLRIRVQPLQARKNPLWMYAGDKDVDRLSTDLSIKDLEKLVRKISSLSKKDTVRSSFRVIPYSATNALPQTVAIPYTCGSSRLFSGAVAGEHSFICKFTWIDIVRCKFSIMGKPRDTKVAILPSTTRKGTTLSTSAALDSPSVISQLVSPPQTSRVGISAESENSSDNFDDASTVLDNAGSLGPFLDATIARSRQIEITETPNENTVTPVNSPEIDDLDEDYVELDDDFIDKCNATTSTSNLKKLIAQHAVRYKLSPDPKFATSPINIKDKDYDFSLDLSHISIVEKTPFCGTEKESAVEHMNELSTLSSLFSDDVKMRTYFVAKIFPFSLKDDAKIWKRTPDEAEELLAKISKNHDDWSTPEPTPTPILKKRGMIELNDEDMREAKKSLMEKGIKSEDVKNLPPIEDLCKIIPPSSTIEYMKDIVSNKRKIPNEEISTMLANYSFNGKVPKKLGDPDKLIPTDISLQMADKSTAIPVGVCENVPVQVTQHCLILTDFVVLEMPEDDNMSIILGRPFLNTAGAVIDCNKGKVTFNVDDKEHTVYFPKRIDKVYGVNTIFNVKTIKVGSIDCPIYEPKEEYQTLVIGSISIQYKRRKMNNYNFGEVFEGETTSTGRPSRASTRIRRSYNEDVIAPSFDEGNGDPNASSFPCYEFLSNAGLLDDFLTLVRKAGLTAYMEDERKQYYMLTKIFVESFKFNNKHFNPTVAFKIYGNPVTMKLKDFCAALGIAPAGTARKIEDNPRVLLELYREITNDDCRTIQRGKIRNIQLPAIKYFAYYLATSILGRENTSNISSYHLAFLIAALTGETPYHLGSVIARRLSNKGPIYGGIIASRILARLDLSLDPTDVEIPPVRLDIAAMKSHQFVTIDSSMDNIVYRMLFADGDEREVLLPQTDLFSIDRKPWSRSKEEVDEKLKIQGFHQQHDSEDAEPSYDYTVTYPVASSSTYLEPGRSSSYYGDTTSWGPWE
ncbi:hypothetical protein QYE76_031880 [Lolium multiflorum]|uniref:Uncharacterized protein n=1 Tax=Lolium multiflorum TaxID=4521 RepID=A0AAD8VHU2_LOLMU|nr:hypothetical protein QYE76_031880 [Lolium multiflorum]